MAYSCGVGNCGNGRCVHVELDRKCPHCGEPLIMVKTSGHVFCSGDFYLCGYEEFKPVENNEK